MIPDGQTGKTAQQIGGSKVRVSHPRAAFATPVEPRPYQSVCGQEQKEVIRRTDLVEPSNMCFGVAVTGQVG